MEFAGSFLEGIDKLSEHLKNDLWPLEFRDRYLRKLEELRLKYQQIQAEELPLKVAFVGEYSAGKSSIINTILGEDFLPTHDLPTTKVVTVLRYSDEHRAEIEYKDGSRSSVKPEKLKNICHHEAQSESPEEDLRIEDIYRIHFYYPCTMLSQIQIVDTPGLSTSTNPEDDQKTIEALKQVDVVIWVFDANTPIKDNLKKAIKHFQKLGLPMIGILNKADTKPNKELEKLILKAKETYNLNKIFCYSAKNVLYFRNKQHELDQLWKEISFQLLQCKPVELLACVQEKTGKFLSRKAKREVLIKIGSEEVRFPCDSLQQWHNQYEQLLQYLEKLRQDILRLQLESLQREFWDLMNEVSQNLQQLEEHIVSKLEKLEEIDLYISEIFSSLIQNVKGYVENESPKYLKAMYNELRKTLEKDVDFDYSFLSLEIVAKFDEDKILNDTYRETLLETVQDSILTALKNIKEETIAKISESICGLFSELRDSDLIKDFNKESFGKVEISEIFKRRFEEFDSNFAYIFNYLAQILARYAIDMYFMLLIYSQKQPLDNLFEKLSNIFYKEIQDFLDTLESDTSIDTITDLFSQYFQKILDFLIEEEHIVFLLKEIFEKFLLGLQKDFEDKVQEAREHLEKLRDKISAFEKECFLLKKI